MSIRTNNYEYIAQTPEVAEACKNYVGLKVSASDMLVTLKRIRDAVGSGELDMPGTLINKVIEVINKTEGR